MIGARDAARWRGLPDRHVGKQRLEVALGSIAIVMALAIVTGRQVFPLVCGYLCTKLPPKKFLIAQTPADVRGLAHTRISRAPMHIRHNSLWWTMRWRGHELQPAALSASYSAVGP
jgi:hypothetical protein